MISYTTQLIERFRNKGVLIDTNLLLLFIVGKFDLNILARESFKRLAAYSTEDFHLIRNLSLLFQRRVTTPHVLAEVNSFIGQLSSNQRSECLRGFPGFLDSFQELPIDSFEVIRHEKFPFLGLTDAALATVAEDFLIVTDDARFVFHLNEMGREALNINHLRQEIWLRGS